MFPRERIGKPVAGKHQRSLKRPTTRHRGIAVASVVAPTPPIEEICDDIGDSLKDGEVEEEPLGVPTRQ